MRELPDARRSNASSDGGVVLVPQGDRLGGFQLAVFGSDGYFYRCSGERIQQALLHPVGMAFLDSPTLVKSSYVSVRRSQIARK